MAIVTPTTAIVMVFRNTHGKISIQQIDKEHGGDSIVEIEPADILKLIGALRLVAKEGAIDA